MNVAFDNDVAIVDEPAPRIAVNCNPLAIVEYTSHAGITQKYGVFWDGYKAGIRKFGLRKLKKDGMLCRPNMCNRGFFVRADVCTILSESRAA